MIRMEKSVAKAVENSTTQLRNLLIATEYSVAELKTQMRK